jgi:Ser-tRNA(Ala) deacylase AlaX
MKPIEGRLQTGEHILAKIIQDKFFDAKIVIAKFYNEEGYVDIVCNEDLRNLSSELIENLVNEVIASSLDVKKVVINRSEVENEFDLSKIPDDLDKIRIVEIEGFDRRPCKDLHVNNTLEIGKFYIKNIKREGKDRYRFKFYVKDFSTIK